MKQLVRGYVWWPNLNAQVEYIVIFCEKCQHTCTLPAKHHFTCGSGQSGPGHASTWTIYAGPFLNKMLLVINDAHSKWLEVLPINNATTTTTIGQFLNVFTTHGLPNRIVSENGSVFTSDNFVKFVKQNGIKHIWTSPYHPASQMVLQRDQFKHLRWV